MKPDKPHQKPRAATDAERAAKYKRTGRQIACVIRDKDAIVALDTQTKKHGSLTAAVTAALLTSASTPRDT